MLLLLLKKFHRENVINIEHLTNHIID